MRAVTAKTGLSLVVAEVYNSVFQGEGPSTGQRCSFLRLGGCNLTCGWARTPHGLERVDGAWACDEAFTWHPGHGMKTRLHRMPLPAITGRLLRDGPMLTVITGGEPLIHQHQPAWPQLLSALLAAGCRIEIETNGTIRPRYTPPGAITHNVSPKLASSGLALTDRIVPGPLAWHRDHGSVFKFVATGPADVAEAAQITAMIPVPPHRVWIMTEGETPTRILAVARDIAPAVTAHGFNLTLRQQALLYGTEGEPRA